MWPPRAPLRGCQLKNVMLEAMVQPEMQPLVVARAVSELLAAFRVAPEALVEAKEFVRRRRVARRKALDAKGYEYVVERLLRPIITMNAAQQLGLPDGTDVRQHVYSSHYHTTDDDDRTYKRLWASFKCNYPQVDTYDAQGIMRRADLFIGLPATMLVSVDFKYVRPLHVLAVHPSTKQIRQYLTK